MPKNLPAAPDSNTFVSVDQAAGRMSRDLYLFFVGLISSLVNRLPVTGSVTFSAATTATVTFGVAEADANYSVFFMPEADNYLWATSKTTAGFTANAKTSNSATIRWALIRA